MTANKIQWSGKKKKKKKKARLAEEVFRTKSTSVKTLLTE